MISKDILDVVRNFDEICDKVVQDGKPIVVACEDNNNVVIISQTEYDNILENIYLIQSPANYAHLLKSINQAKQGKLIRFDEPGDAYD